MARPSKISAARRAGAAAGVAMTWWPPVPLIAGLLAVAVTPANLAGAADLEIARGVILPVVIDADLGVASGNLDRIQIIKGWLDDDGETHEKVYDVVWGDADTRDPGADGKLPAVGNTVDVANATWTNSIGDPELITVWEDPDFDPSQPAFYYARVIEIPTPRWTAYDAKRYGITMDPEIPMTTQERAYTSPIWYTP